MSNKIAAKIVEGAIKALDALTNAMTQMAIASDAFNAQHAKCHRKYRSQDERTNLQLTQKLK